MNNQVSKQKSEIAKELYSTAEAAKYLGVTPPTFRDKRKSGEWKIPVVKIGRLHKFARKDLEAFIKNHREAI